MFQASFLNKKINIGGKRVNLSIWDTAGQERFHALGPIYYRMSNGAISVYDITDEDSFQKVCCNKLKEKTNRQERYL
jgi:Ras-related protein Rab-21